MKTLCLLLVLFVLAIPAAALANPKIDFNAHCAKCHRANKALPIIAKQLGVDPGKLALRGSKMTREEMIAIVEKGKDKMPAFENEMTGEGIAELVDYILILKKRPNIQFNPSKNLKK